MNALLIEAIVTAVIVIGLYLLVHFAGWDVFSWVPGYSLMRGLVVGIKGIIYVGRAIDGI